jgi:hypothetical protein
LRYSAANTAQHTSFESWKTTFLKTLSRNRVSYLVSSNLGRKNPKHLLRNDELCEARPQKIFRTNRATHSSKSISIGAMRFSAQQKHLFAQCLQQFVLFILKICN